MCGSCGSGTGNANDNEKRVNALLDSVGILEIVEQGRWAISEAGKALAYLNRSERAIALGFEPEVARMTSEAATRVNQRAQEQIRTVLSRIDFVREGDDWAAHVERIRSGFAEHNGRKMLDDARADVLLRLLEDEPGLSASAAHLAVAGLDGAIDAASDGDLDQVVGYMRLVMENALQGFSEPEMGRQSVGHDLLDQIRGAKSSKPARARDEGACTALLICLAWAWSSFIASIIICAVVPFCWCCFAWAAGLTLAAHQTLCGLIFGTACNG